MRRLILNLKTQSLSVKSDFVWVSWVQRGNFTTYFMNDTWFLTQTLVGIKPHSLTFIWKINMPLIYFFDYTHISNAYLSKFIDQKSIIYIWTFLPSFLSWLCRTACSHVWYLSRLITKPTKWSESSLGAQVILLVLSCDGSFFIIIIYVNLRCTYHSRYARTDGHSRI